MALNFTGSTSSGILLSSSGDIWITLLGESVSGPSIGFDFGAQSDTTYILEGGAGALDTAISSIGSSSNNTILVTELGSANAGNYGVNVNGNGHQMVNNGDIFGASVGIHVSDVNPITTTIVNTGRADGTFSGVAIDGDGGSLHNTGTVLGGTEGVFISHYGAVVVNYGDIVGDLRGIASGLFGIGTSDTNVFHNFGIIRSLDPDFIGNNPKNFHLAFFGGEGRDVIYNSGTLDGNVRLGAGDDKLQSRKGDIVGEVYGGSGEDRLIGGAAVDRFFGGRDADVLKGNGGRDYLKGESGDDVLMGNKGADKMFGGNDDDMLYGGDGNDTMYGGNGADILAGGRGRDALTGGTGADIFVFNANAGNDTIRDFSDGSDLIDLTELNVTAGAVNAAIFDISGNAILDITALGGTGVITINGAAGLVDDADFLL